MTRHHFSFALLTLFLAIGTTSQAATVSWTNAAGGNWHTASNWSGNAVPAAGDDVQITLDGTYTVTLDTVGVTVNSLTIGAATGTNTQTLVSSRQITIAAPSTVAARGVLTWSGGRLEGAGPLVVSGTFNSSSGTLAANVNVLATATWNINSGCSLTVATINNAGTAILTGNTAWDVSAGAVINNSGLFEVRNDQPVYIFGGGPAPTWNNSGTFRKSQGTGTTDMGVGAFNNTGVVEVLTGTLRLSNGGTHSGTFTTAAGANLDLSVGGSNVHRLNTGTNFTGAGFGGLTGGSMVIAGAVTAQNFKLAGGSITGTGTLQISGTFNHDFGTLGGSTTILPSATWNLNAAHFFGGTVTNQGTAIVTGTNALDAGGGAIINNSGVWDWRTDAPVYIFGGGAAPTWNNSGTVLKTVGVGVSDFGVGAFTNTGTIEVRTGTLGFSGGLTQTTGVTRLKGGNLRGRTTIQGGVLEGNGKIDASTLTISSGTLSPGLAGSSQLIGALKVTGSYVQSGGGAMNVDVGGTDPNQFDRIEVAGATLGGTLNVALINGFRPQTGDIFRIITFLSSSSGDFATRNGLMLGGNDRLIPYKLAAGYDLVTNQLLADLGVTQTGTPNPVTVGQNVTYSVRVTNHGPLAATSVILIDNLAAGAAFVSGPTGCSGTTSISCNLGDLAAGVNRDISIVVRAPSIRGTFANRITVASNETDRFPENSSSMTYLAAIQSSTDLAITSLNPTGLTNGGDERVLTINGQGFLPGAVVTLDLGDRVEPYPDPGDVIGTVTSLSTTQIQAMFDLDSELYGGEWDVVVTNSDTLVAKLPIQIVPTILWPDFEPTGTLGFAVGRYNTNYVDVFSIGNNEGVVLVEIEPPVPGVIQLKVGPFNAPLWDSTVEADKTRAVVMVFLEQGKSARIPLHWRIPPEKVIFSNFPSLASLAVRAQQDAGVIAFNSEHDIVFNGRTIPKSRLKKLLKDFLLSKEVCTYLGEVLSGVDDTDIRLAVARATTEALEKQVEPESFIKDVVKELAKNIPVVDKFFKAAEFSAKIGGCAANILGGMVKGYEIEAKKIADEARRLKGENWEATELHAWRIAHEQSDLRSGSIIRLDRIEEQFKKNPCTPFVPRVVSRQPSRTPVDPNDKRTNSFYSCEIAGGSSPTPCVRYFTSLNEPLEFVILFENKKEATAAAVDVTITDDLDANLDISSLQVLDSSHPAVLTTTTNGQRITFHFTNINLPPNVNPPEGEGFVRFRVNPVAGIAPETEVRNRASIVFDFNPAILTPEIVYVFSSDGDQDGIIDRVENAAPNSGDGNGDGMPDRQQPAVTSLPLVQHNRYVTLVSGGGCSQNHNVRAVAEAAQSLPDEEFRYLSDLLSFSLPCSSAQVTMLFHGMATLSGSTLRHHVTGTPGVEGTRLWYSPLGATTGTTTVGGATVATASFSLADGVLGDDSPADGQIVNTAGAGTPVSKLQFSSIFFATSESRGRATVSVSRTGSASGAVSVNYSTVDGSATAAADYTASTGTLSWTDGDTSPKSFDITIAADSLTEGDEALMIVLSAPSGNAELARVTQVTVSIVERPGDANGDDVLSVADIFYLINHLFASGQNPVRYSDVNADANLTAADVLYLVNHLFAGGPAPL